jgi:hypothetical protein
MRMRTSVAASMWRSPYCAWSEVAQLSGQFHARGAAADDHDVQAGARIMRLAHVGQRQQLQHPQPEAFGVVRAVERERVIRDARHAEVVGHAADGQHQRDVADVAFGQHLLGFVHHGADDQLAGRGVQPRHRAVEKGEAVVVRQHLVRQAFLVDVQRARGHFVQRRLPDVEQRGVHQRDPLRAPPAAQLAGQFESAGAAADNEYREGLVSHGGSCCWGHLSVYHGIERHAGGERSTQGLSRWPRRASSTLEDSTS